MGRQGPGVKGEVHMSDQPLGKVIKPKSDVFSVMLVISFTMFLGTFILSWVWLSKAYDSGFPGLHGHKVVDEMNRRKAVVRKGMAELDAKAYLPTEQQPELTDYDEKEGLPRLDDNLKQYFKLEDALKRYEAEAKDELLMGLSGVGKSGKDSKPVEKDKPAP